MNEALKSQVTTKADLSEALAEIRTDIAGFEARTAAGIDKFETGIMAGFDRIDARFDRIHAGLDRLDAGIDRLDAATKTEFDKLRAQGPASKKVLIKWMIATQLGGIAIVAMLVVVLLQIPR